MFQDIGKQMVHGAIAQQLQKGIGAIGKAMGIDLAGSKPDGTKNNPIWVQMAGMAGLNLGGDESAPIIPGTGSFPEIGGGFGSILSKLGGLFGHMGGGIFSFLAGLIPHAAGGMVSPDSAYLVGENGPEILMGASGQIASNSASQRMMSGGGPTHYYNIDARGTDPVLTEQRTRAAIMAAHNSAVANSQLVSDEQLKRTPSPHRY